MRTSRVLSIVGVSMLVVVGACSDDAGTEGGTGTDGGTAGDGAATGSDGSVTPNNADGSAATGSDGSASDASPEASQDAAPDAPTSCVTKSVVIATIQGSSGQCSFAFNQTYDAAKINLILSPGWGTVCYAGSSSNCGSGASADGWWFSGPGEISVCDATCARFEKQTIAGKLTVQHGCATDACTH